MSLEESFTKAAEGLAKAAAPESGQAAPAPEAPQTQNAGQAETSTQTAPETPAPADKEREWDGKPESLPTELKQDPKAIQRAYTRKAMALADAEKKLKELDGIKKEDFEAYRQWKQQQEVARQQALVQQPLPPTQLTPEQMELIKNDPTALTTYVNSLVAAQIQEAAKVIAPQIAQMQQAQSVAQSERMIEDFGAIHPDMWEMAEAGLFKPILEDTVRRGGSLEEAYAQASKIRDAFRTKAEVEAQAGVRAKREAASLSGTTSGADDTVYVDDSRHSLEKAFDLAFSKKEFVPKDATVKPSGRVKVRKHK